MSTNPDPTTTYRHNICGSMADRHDSGPGIIRCGDMPRDIIEFRDLHGQIERKNLISACLLALRDIACNAEHLDEDFREAT